jgi:hypothetical protein
MQSAPMASAISANNGINEMAAISAAAWRRNNINGNVEINIEINDIIIS